jgi:hypothetical protein
MPHHPKVILQSTILAARCRGFVAIASAMGAALGCPVASHAHLIGNAGHDATALRFAREFGSAHFAQVVPPNREAAATAPRTAAMFERFAPAVRMHSDEKFIHVESNGADTADAPTTTTITPRHCTCKACSVPRSPLRARSTATRSTG